jgi:hypothetical protein
MRRGLVGARERIRLRLARLVESRIRIAQGPLGSQMRSEFVADQSRECSCLRFVSCRAAQVAAHVHGSSAGHSSRGRRSQRVEFRLRDDGECLVVVGVFERGGRLL